MSAKRHAVLACDGEDVMTLDARSEKKRELSKHEMTGDFKLDSLAKLTKLAVLLLISRCRC